MKGKKKVAGLAGFIAVSLIVGNVYARSFYCQYAKYNPAYAAICAIEVLADMIYGGLMPGDPDGLGG